MSWDFYWPPEGVKGRLDPEDVTNAVLHSEALSEALYEHAVRISPLMELRFPPQPRWRRVLSRIAYTWDEWRPRLHLGPCPRYDE